MPLRMSRPEKKCERSCSSILILILSGTYAPKPGAIGRRTHLAYSYHADQPAALVKLQEAHWKPILDWARSAHDVEITTTNSLLVPSQPPETILKFNEVLSKFSSWEMAGMSGVADFLSIDPCHIDASPVAAMERATYTSKSFLIALALVKRHIDVDQAAQAAHVEVNSQIERWGEVEDSA